MVSIQKGAIRSDEETSAAHRLLQAARSGQVAEVSAVLSSASPSLAACDALTQSGRSLLHIAAHHGHVGVVLAALAQDPEVDVNVTNKVCWHPPCGPVLPVPVVWCVVRRQAWAFASRRPSLGG